MTPIPRDRLKNMVIGALVADAAAVGLHWLYDQDRIKKVAPVAPEFLEPDARNFDGAPGVFVHSARKSGDTSQYGTQTLLMLRTLAASGETHVAAEFAERFRAHFGYGGAYEGYIDNTTRETLDNARRFQDAAEACAKSLAFDGDDRTRKKLVSIALPLLARYTGDDLTTRFMADVTAFHDDDTVRSYGRTLLTALQTLEPMRGAFDLQLPAIAKLPALVALSCANGVTEGAVFETRMDDAVRVTNDHPTAAAYAQICAHMMAGALCHGSTPEAVATGRAAAAPDAAAVLDDAIAREDEANTSVTRHFGMACDLPFGIPSAIHNLATTTSFTDAVRQNIFAGGDSCGRAILVGAVSGAVYGRGGPHGIPEAWIDKLSCKTELQELLAQVFGAD